MHNYTPFAGNLRDSVARAERMREAERQKRFERSVDAVLGRALDFAVRILLFAVGGGAIAMAWRFFR